MDELEILIRWYSTCKKNQDNKTDFETYLHVHVHVYNVIMIVRLHIHVHVYVQYMILKIHVHVHK